ncbi:ATP-binding protein [Shewanella sp. 125m-7]
MTKLAVSFLLIMTLLGSPFVQAFELAPQDKTFLQNKNVLVVAMPSAGLRTHWNMASSEFQGRYSEYIIALGQQLNIKIEFREYNSLDKLLGAIVSGEADLSLGFSSTVEREKSLLFSVPVFKNYQLKWLRNSTYRNTSPSDMNWVCIKDSFSCEATAKFSVKSLIKVESLDSLIHHLSTGKADGAVIQFSAVHHYYQTVAVGDWLGDIVFIEDTEPVLSSFVTAKNNPTLMKILNQYQQVHQHGLAIQPFNFNNLSLLHNELALEAIYQHYNRKTIHYTIEEDLYPLSYIQEDTGEISGYIHDIMKIYALKTGLNFEYVYPNGRDVDEMLEQAIVDFIPGRFTTQPSDISTQPFYTVNWSTIRTTKPYVQTKVAILARTNHISIQDTFSFLSNTPVIYSDFTKLKKDIKNGDITHAYIPESIAQQYLYYGNGEDFELIIDEQPPLKSLMSITLNSTSFALRNMLDVAIAITTENEISLVVQHHEKIHTLYGYDKKQTINAIILLLILVAISILVVFLWNKKLKVYLSEAIANGKKSNDEMLWLITILNSFPGMVIISDAKGKPLLSNQAYNDYIANAAPCSFIDIEIAHRSNMTNEGLATTSNECFIAGKYYRVSREVVHHNDGQAYHITVFTDFTELKASKRQAVEALKTRESFLAIISHELRTPLAAMMGLMELLSPELKSLKNKELMKNAQASAERLKGLVNDILDFSKMEADQLQLDSYNSSLFEELGSTLRLLAANIKFKQVNFILDWQPTTLCCAELDWLRLSQIVNNLVSNAIKFTQHGFIKVSVSNTSNVLSLVIEDSGCGMTPEQQQKLFQPFVQADASINRKYGGSGLGMSIVQHLVELMGGQITVTSELNRGTKVTVNLPAEFTALDLALISEAYAHDEAIKNWLTLWGVTLNQNATGVLTVESTAEANNIYPDLLLRQILRSNPHSKALADAKNKRYLGKVLVADDDAINRFLLQNQLSKLGVDVVTVNDGLEALLYLAANKNNVSLLITDCHMPNLNGYDLVRQLRAKPEFNNLPIVGCTAEDSRLVAEKAHQVGMSEVLYKPYSFILLSEVLGRYCVEQSNDMNQEVLEWLRDYSAEEQLELSAVVRDSLLADKTDLVEKNIPLSALGHRIKGAANALGLNQLATAAANCETVAPNDVPEAIKRIVSEIDTIVNAINRWLIEQNQ